MIHSIDGLCCEMSIVIENKGFKVCFCDFNSEKSNGGCNEMETFVAIKLVHHICAWDPLQKVVLSSI